MPLFLVVEIFPYLKGFVENYEMKQVYTSYYKGNKVS